MGKTAKMVEGVRLGRGRRSQEEEERAGDGLGVLYIINILKVHGFFYLFFFPWWNFDISVSLSVSIPTYKHTMPYIVLVILKTDMILVLAITRLSVLPMTEHDGEMLWPS